MIGAGITISGEDEVAVTPPTVTIMAPLSAFAGMVTTRVVGLAETTVTAIPPTVTTSSAGFVLKPRPLIVMFPPEGIVEGVTLKIVSAPGATVDRLI